MSRRAGRPARALTLLVTCEHASARVPAALAHLFRGQEAILTTHRAVDLGALPVARALAKLSAEPLLAGSMSRLVVDLNRSANKRGVFSRYSGGLPAEDRARLLSQVHRPHWEAVAAAVTRLNRSGARVLHLGVHSFTPVLEGRARPFEIGLLYDPSRDAERGGCRSLARILACAEPRLRVRANQPYRGTSDGLTTAFRARFDPEDYLGVELELNQAALSDRGGRTRLARFLVAAVASVVRA